MVELMKEGGAPSEKSGVLEEVAKKGKGAPPVEELRLALNATKDLIAIKPANLGPKDISLLKNEITKTQEELKQVKEDYATFMLRHFPVWTWGKHPEAMTEMSNIRKKAEETIDALNKIFSEAKNCFDSYQYFTEKGDKEKAQKMLESALSAISTAMDKSREINGLPKKVAEVSKILQNELDETQREGLMLVASGVSIMVGWGVFSIASKAIGTVTTSSLLESAGAGFVSSATGTAAYDSIAGTVSLGHLAESGAIGLFLGPLAHLSHIPGFEKFLGGAGKGGRIIRQLIEEVAQHGKLGKNAIVGFKEEIGNKE